MCTFCVDLVVDDINWRMVEQGNVWDIAMPNYLGVSVTGGFHTDISQFKPSIDVHALLVYNSFLRSIIGFQDVDGDGTVADVPFREVAQSLRRDRQTRQETQLCKRWLGSGGFVSHAPQRSLLTGRAPIRYPTITLNEGCGIICNCFCVAVLLNNKIAW